MRPDRLMKFCAATAFTRSLQQQHERSDHAKPRDPVAPARIHRHVAAKRVGRIQLARDHSRQARHDPAIRIDRNGDRRYWCRAAASAGFPPRARAPWPDAAPAPRSAEPAVIRNVDRAVPRRCRVKRRTSFGENRFVADENAETPAGQSARLCIPCRAENRRPAPSDPSAKQNQIAPGNVFAEREPGEFYHK